MSHDCGVGSCLTSADDTRRSAIILPELLETSWCRRACRRDHRQPSNAGRSSRGGSHALKDQLRDADYAALHISSCLRAMPGPNSSCDRKFLSFSDRFHSTPAAALTFSLLVSPGFRVLPEDEEGCKSTRHFQLFFLECHSLSEPEFRVVEKFLLFPSEYNISFLVPCACLSPD